MRSNPKKVAIFGSSGSLGRQIANTCNEFGIDVITRDRSNLSLAATLGDLRDDLEREAPTHVVNCVAQTGLQACQDDPENALQTNAVFSMRLCAAAALLGVDYYYFSTEYAFACNIQGKTYREDDLPGPTTVYGLTKFLGEPPESGQTSATIRLPLLYGPTHEGQIVGALLARMRSGEPVRVADDVFSTPVCSIDVADYLVRAILSDEKHPSLVHLTSGTLLSLYDTVRVFAEHDGCADLLQPAKSSDFVPDGSKPRFGGLVSQITSALPSVETNLGSL